MTRPTLLEQAMSAEVLDKSWRKLNKEHTPWSINVTRDQLQQHLLKSIIECREQVLSGKYKPQPLRQFPMQKPDGNIRVLSAQYLQDKLIQRALLIVLQPKMEAVFHEDSYAYRPNRNVEMALQKVRERVKIGQSWLVDADIQSFFDNIPLNRLQKILKNFINDAPTMKLINLWLAQGTHHNSLLSVKRGISQGAILSPLFCNLYLHQFDLAISQKGIPFVRFADDFLLFTDQKSKAEKALDYAAEQLQKLDLKIHPEKTRIIKSSRNVKFLGEYLPAAH